MDTRTAVLGLATVVSAISMIGTLWQVVLGNAPNAKAIFGRIAMIAVCATAVAYFLLPPAKSSSQAAVVSPAVLTAESHYQKAKQFYDDHNRPQAIKESRQALIMEPTHKEAHKLLGACYYLDHNMSAAASEYKQASTLDPDDTESELALAMCLDVLGSRQEAKEAYQYILRHPQSTTSQRQTAQERLQVLGG